MARAVVNIKRMDQNTVFSAQGVVVQWRDLASHFKHNLTTGRLQYIKCSNCGGPTLLHQGDTGDGCANMTSYTSDEGALLMDKVWDNPVLTRWRQEHAQHVETPGREQGQARSEEELEKILDRSCRTERDRLKVVTDRLAEVQEQIRQHEALEQGEIEDAERVRQESLAMERLLQEARHGRAGL